MIKTLALALSVILAISILTFISFQQLSAAKEKVKLIDWKANPCDDTYDPYRLVNRITEIRTQGETTFLTISFRESCCSRFNPQIDFKGNKLFLLAYKGDPADSCACTCCFSIEFAIEQLPASEYQTYFHGKKIELSNDHYKTTQPTSEVYKGNTINRMNRYGFKEGLWMTFYKDGSIESIEQYPESELYYEESPLWKKDFYPSGQLSFFSRNDSTEYWFKDGTLKSQFTEYSVGDTTYKKVFCSYDNRRLSERSLERSYPTSSASKLDPGSKAGGSETEILYHEKYYKTGQLKSRFGKDTTYTWHESGKIASREFKEGTIAYDEDGFVTERAFYWQTKGPAVWGDMHNSLYAEIGRDGKVLKIHFVRDEIIPDGIVPSAHYNWTWNEAGKLIESPEEWKEPLPWTKFNQLRIR
ncbi:hypothetical protein [Dawidia soli]|uniref:Uncharacterized protein n=1 Tax=Dawidia soli TaxID=2782352 RepID=A0AAP2GFB9_9BACT|nr:hypothetical protein [Dawidia soli]MBT1689332.1 hypothetical protein [Dawidia soli]